MSRKIPLAEIPGYPPSFLLAFQRGGLINVTDLFALAPQDISKKCSISTRIVNEMVDIASKALTTQPRPLTDASFCSPSVFTTGDVLLDRMLGGGLRTGMVWEIVGEGAAGKTQLALQLSLFVQLPVLDHGLCGTTCYLTSYASLPTSRLVEIFEEHDQLAIPNHNPLEHIVTLETKSSEMLCLVLSKKFPLLLSEKKARGRPVKLLVIDAIADLFQEDRKTTTTQLAERSRSLSMISMLLHELAAKHNIAVVVLNHVGDVWEHPETHREDNELIYADQARIFGSGYSLAGETHKRAALGLVWANQINARIMLTRTGRRRALGNTSQSSTSKRIRTNYPHARQPTVVSEDKDMHYAHVRRLSIVFSSVGAACSADFMINQKGVCLFADSFNSAALPNLPSGHNAAIETRKDHTSSSKPTPNAPLSSDPSSLGATSEDAAVTGADEEIYWRDVDDHVDWDTVPDVID